jgi:predicted transcriptional regulator
MGQVTIYLEDSIEQKMTEAARSAHLSKSKWVAQVISERVVTEWPQSIVDMAGAWEDFPSADELRQNESVDSEREQF